MDKLLHYVMENRKIAGNKAQKSTSDADKMKNIPTFTQVFKKMVIVPLHPKKINYVLLKR